jgi:PAS domain-containing protein
MQASPDSAARRSTAVPAAVRRIVARCLAKSPDRRYRSGKELAEALTKVLAEIDAAELEKSRQRIVPLRVKWAATMALIVAVVMALTATVITQRQYAAMISQATDSGASLARFIAAQNAVSALSEDWVAVEVAIQEIMKAKDFQGVTVIDKELRVLCWNQAFIELYELPVDMMRVGRGLDEIVRFNAEIIPDVTDGPPSSASAYPIAITWSPMRIVLG